VTFSLKDELRQISRDEVYSIWTKHNLEISAKLFREASISGALIALLTEEMIEWKVWGEIPEEKRVK
jgi:hypothetical protein